MKIKNFAIERYFAKHEFTAKYLLSSSDCDGFPMQYVLDLASKEELESWNNLRLIYTETRGSLPLRSSIAQHYNKIGVDKIVVGSPGELNFALMNVLLKRGDEVICMAPMYQSMYQVAKSIGCKLKFWKPETAKNQWYYNPSELEALITPKTRLIVLNFPHNPTGFSPNMADLNAMINIARKHGIVIFSDEMYQKLVFEPSQLIPSVADIYENGVALWGTAKTFGLAGLRLGWLASQNSQILDKVEAYKDYLSICNSATSEILGTIAMNNADKFIQSNIEKIKANIQIFTRFCERNADFIEFPIPKSGSTAFVRLKIKGTTLAYADNLVEASGIMLLPAETFEYGTKHVRIGFGRANFEECLGVWEKYILMERR
jgi:aspartate/methionine/tyrosine aminotransferase